MITVQQHIGIRCTRPVTKVEDYIGAWKNRSTSRLTVRFSEKDIQTNKTKNEPKTTYEIAVEERIQRR
jgi:hypothetical protein